MGRSKTPKSEAVKRVVLDSTLPDRVLAEATGKSERWIRHLRAAARRRAKARELERAMALADSRAAAAAGYASRESA